MHGTGTSLQASYFDGRSARPQPVTLRLHSEGRQRSLHILGDGVDLQVPTHQIQWPERTRHGQRLAHLAGGGHVQCDDGAAWDAWAQSQGQHESLVVKMQQSWRWVAGSVAVLATLAVALQLWGLPLLARAVVAATPPGIEKTLGESTLAAVDETLMRPSKLPLAEQARITQALTDAVAHQDAASQRPWKLVFRQSKIGPNALALPGGTLIMTDEMVALVNADAQVLTAVLAHELGHVQQRHGLRMLVQATVLGAVGAVVLGDFSTLLAAVPALLGQAHYSREAEREADAHAVKVLKDAGLSPLHMVTLFEALEQERQKKANKAQDKQEGKAAAEDENSASWLGIAFASHPSDADRIAYFRAAAQ